MLWTRYALDQLAYHVKEDPRPGEDNPLIVAYHAVTAGGASPDEVPWCSSFVCWCVERAGLHSPRSKWARSWLTWADGVQISTPVFGAITVLARGTPGSNQGHVGILVSWRPGFVGIVSGNVQDTITVDWFRDDRLLGYRWPKEVPIPDWATGTLVSPT